jgi:hypothetical protein
MNEKAKSKCNEVYRYAELLLRERQRELKALELKHQHQQIAHDDYLSCRRALQRAISELSILLLNDPEPVAVNPTSPDESNHSIPTPEAELRRLIR